MQLDTIAMDKGEARQAFLAYRDAVRARHSAEDAAIMRGYRALSQGRQLIRLSEVIAAGGTNDQDLPALAVTRADRREAWLTISGGEVVFHHADPWDVPANAGPAAGTHRFPTEVFAGKVLRSAARWDRWKPMVPIIPPALRPAHALSGYHILWEVDRWEKVPNPPHDPALLKWLGGDLYAVLAVWDLTEVERAVLAGRRG